MPGPHFTKCFDFAPGMRPFHEDDLVALGIVHIVAGLLVGAVTGVAAGYFAGGPIGAVVGAFAGGYAAAATAITEGADKWLNHRLVCLSGRQCAVGTLKTAPEIADVGELDNDEFFDMALMPYPPDRAFEPNGDPSEGAEPANDAAKKALADFPANAVFDDGFQGQSLIRPRDDLLEELGYFKAAKQRTRERAEVTQNWLHCEAEGDFWVRMRDMAVAIGLLGGAAAATTAAAAVGGAAAGCAIGAAFFGIGCVIGAIIGALLGLALGGLGSAVAVGAVLDGVFEEAFKTNPGDVDDANVGDEPLGELRPGDRVVVFGEHVYDGFHEGWHEIHPLLAICKVATFKMEGGSEESFYLQWQPDFPSSGTPPTSSLPDLALPPLTVQDMRMGLASPNFRARAQALRDRWCRLLSQRFDDPVGEAQQGLDERWTIHPCVDGCAPAQTEHDDVPR